MASKRCLKCKRIFDWNNTKYCSWECAGTVHGIIHGMTGTRFHMTWMGMKQRCKDNGAYGKRGIKLCKRWLRFENFKKDMYKDYLLHVKKFGQNNTTIERLNNKRGYTPKNCRWATWAEQALNRQQPYIWNPASKRYYTLQQHTPIV